MNVSMDGLRYRLISSYNSLTRKLNNGVNDDSFDFNSIKNEMDNIRDLIVT